MTTKSGSAGSQDYEDQKDWFVPVQQTHNDFSSPFYEFQRPGENVQHNEAKASWRSLFAFTTRQHSTTVAGALVATILAGIIRPTAAILFGKLWNALTVYGAGNVNAKEMLHQVSIWCIALTVLGAGTWIVEGIFFSLWMLFGELQARSVRQIMFSGMRDKSMEWYDLREDGMASLLNRIET
jgi:ATP-binding cassette, subfamily B (MDR/TAP), member 1